MRGLGSNRTTKFIASFTFLFSLAVVFQQCSDVNLVRAPMNVSTSTSLDSNTMDAPISYRSNRNYIIMVDMSNSMISAPCPQDIGAGILFTATPAYETYDPNKGVGDGNDHRGSSYGCQTNSTLDIIRSAIQVITPNVLQGIFFQTPRGMDHEGTRFETIEAFISLISISPLKLRQ
ncbi:MAG: hypothetical protein R2827_05700 [Bdellovibrionales bacterium]